MGKIFKLTLATLICLSLNIFLTYDINCNTIYEKKLDDVNLKMANNRAKIVYEEDIKNVVTTKVVKEVIIKNEVKKEIIKEKSKKIVAISRGLPRATDGSYKSFMCFRALTNTNSKQHALQETAHTDKNGFRRIDKFYLVAMGSYYSETIGSKFRITLEGNKVIYVMLGDAKNKKHTDSNHQYNPPNKNVIEFIVDDHKINGLSRRMGDVSYSEGDILKGKILKIEQLVE